MENKTPMRVVFGLIENEPIAFLLDAETGNSDRIMSYMHVGQHSEASVEFYSECKLALPKDYEDLLAELESIGYAINDMTPAIIRVSGRR